MSTELVIGVNAKYCSKCGELKSYINFTARKRNKDGKESQCKTCIKELPSSSKENCAVKRRRYYLKHQDAIREQKRLEYSENPEYSKAISKAWKDANREHVNQYSRDYYKENTNLVLTRAKAYRDANKEILSIRNRIQYEKDIEFSRERAREWQRNNPGKASANWVRRRHRLNLSAPAWLTNKDLQDIASFYVLAKALKSASGECFHVDHIIPLKHDLVCGLHVPWNLQVLTATENLRKSNKFTVG
jgi:hypothetical protein